MHITNDTTRRVLTSFKGERFNVVDRTSETDDRSSSQASKQEINELDVSIQDLQPDKLLQTLSVTSSVWTTLNQPQFIEKLKSLDLSSNSLNQLPPCVLHMIQLKTLILNQNKLQSLPNLSALNKLTSFQVESNQLQSSAIDALPLSLKTVSFMSNRFIEIPPTVLILTNVTVLNLSKNQIIHLIGIESMVSLLNLNDNQLQELPSSLSALTQLQTLLLENNQIHDKSPTTNQQSIPEVVFLHTRLERLELAGNPITKYQLQEYQGINRYIDRRKVLNDKLFQGGITKVETNLCGLTA